MPKMSLDVTAEEYDLLRRVLKEYLESLKMLRSGQPASWERTRPPAGLSPRMEAQLLDSLLEKVER